MLYMHSSSFTVTSSYQQVMFVPYLITHAVVVYSCVMEYYTEWVQQWG